MPRKKRVRRRRFVKAKKKTKTKARGSHLIRMKPLVQSLQNVTTDSKTRVVPKRHYRKRKKYSEFYKNTPTNRRLNRVGMRK